MRVLAVLTALTLALTLLAGCTPVSGAGLGGLAGGLAGAGIGAIAGDTAAGALLGTGIGLGAGALFGQENERYAYYNGWVYDDVWGSRGHYIGQPVYAEQPYYSTPPAYAPVAYQSYDQPYYQPYYQPYAGPSPWLGNLTIGAAYWGSDHHHRRHH